MYTRVEDSVNNFHCFFHQLVDLQIIITCDKTYNIIQMVVLGYVMFNITFYLNYRTKLSLCFNKIGDALSKTCPFIVDSLT
jgi:hypothetical protein